LTSFQEFARKKWRIKKSAALQKPRQSACSTASTNPPLQQTQARQRKHGARGEVPAVD
jgi:hypothetical protein